MDTLLLHSLGVGRGVASKCSDRETELGSLCGRPERRSYCDCWEVSGAARLAAKEAGIY